MASLASIVFERTRRSRQPPDLSPVPRWGPISTHTSLNRRQASVEVKCVPLLTSAERSTQTPYGLELCRTSTPRPICCSASSPAPSVRDIAAELNVSERTVRNRLRGAGIPLPSVRKAAGVDVNAVLADYRTGTPVRTIAQRHQVGETWVRRRIAAYGVARDVPLKRKSPAPRYAQLADRRWLLERMADGASVYAVAKELRTGTRTIYHALRRHGLTWPPPTADPSSGSRTSTTTKCGPRRRSGSSTRPRRWRTGRGRCGTSECQPSS